MYLRPDEVDSRLNWRAGRAERLAKQGKLPHDVLPDGAIRFVWTEVAALISHSVPQPTGGVT